MANLGRFKLARWDTWIVLGATVVLLLMVLPWGGAEQKEQQEQPFEYRKGQIASSKHSSDFVLYFSSLDTSGNWTFLDVSSATGLNDNSNDYWLATGGLTE